MPRPAARRAAWPLVWANLALLVLFPVSWFAPLLRAGLLTLFGLAEISVASGTSPLWETDVALAVLVATLALVAPLAKTLWMAMIHLGRVRGRGLGVLRLLGHLAMADVFLVALYIVLAKGVGVGRVETAWGLHLFTGCVIASLAISRLTPGPAVPALR